MILERLIPLILIGITAWVGLMASYRILTPIIHSPFSDILSGITDGLNRLSRRFIWSFVQIVVYLIIVFVLVFLKVGDSIHVGQIAAFLFGSVAMPVATYLSLRLSPRIAHAVYRSADGYFTPALRTLIIGCSGLGFLIATTILGGLMITSILFGIPEMIGYGLGILLSGILLRIGGGLLKSGTDIASEVTVKRVENVPKFDRRNPGTLLEITGDFFSEVIGFSSDLLGSYCVTLISATFFAYTLMAGSNIDPELGRQLIYLPMILAGISLLASLFGFAFILLKRNNPHNIFMENVYISTFLTGIGGFFIIHFIDTTALAPGLLHFSASYSLFLPFAVGLLGAVVLGFCSDILTSHVYRPVKTNAKNAEFGPAVSFLNILQNSYLGTAVYIVSIGFVALFAYGIGGFYGIAIAALGMTSVTPTILIMQILRPLASNAHKIAILADENSHRGSNLRGLDHLTGTVSALGNSFVSSASIMSAISLLAAAIFLIQANFQRLFLLDINIIAGILLAFAVFMLFSRFLLQSLVHLVKLIVTESTRQLRDVAFLYEDKTRPDMIAATDKCAIYIMKAMALPTTLLLIMPIISGYFLGIPFLFGYSAGAFLCVFLFAFQWSVFGDSASQSKRFIATGQYGGADSKNFETIAISDSIGDGMKDLLNPSANTFLKVTGMMVLLILYFLI